ncbi:MAG: MATE family efflux transporter [Cellulosilyticaceae bacterium]
MNDLTKGKPLQQIVQFAIPMMIGNLVQQLYNIVDAIVVGKFVGSDGLAAVSGSFTVMVFLTSIIIGLTMGAGVVYAQYFGAKNDHKLKQTILIGTLCICGVTIVIGVGSLYGLEWIIRGTQIPTEIRAMTRTYLSIVISGMIFVFLYNHVAAILRAIGDSRTPLYFLILSALINIVLDLLLTGVLHMGVQGVAVATFAAQGVSALLCVVYGWYKLKFLRFTREDLRWDKTLFSETMQYAVLTSIQQSIMNFGILMVQGLVNSFGVTAMAAFGVVNKIDAFAYMPVQDFGNAFATYVAQNKGAHQYGRIKEGVRYAVCLITGFCSIVSIVVLSMGEHLIRLFVRAEEQAVIETGLGYLQIVAPYYILIGFLFMYYGYYRGMGKAQMSILLTLISLGTRVALAYGLAAMPQIGLSGVWWAIPIGWALADSVGWWQQWKGSAKRDMIRDC